MDGNADRMPRLSRCLGEVVGVVYATDMRVVSESDVMEELPSLLEEIKTHAVVISDGEEELGALVSMEDYEIVRKAKVDRLFHAMDEFGEQIRVRAAADGLTPDELMEILDRKAS